MNLNLDKINAFLHYGYIPDPWVELPDSLRHFFNGELSGHDHNYATAELIKQGSAAIKKSFQNEIRNDYNKLHIVPLSGGLDSRTILANLLELVEPSRIITITFGIPGSPNYERARFITRKTGIKWENIDLSPGKWIWTTGILTDTAKRSQRPTRLFDSAVNHAIQLRFGKDCVYWSGLMGDSLSRISPLASQSTTWDQAKAVFSKKNCKCEKYKLTANHFLAVDCLPEKHYCNHNRLDYYSQLNYCIRQQCFTKHIYSPTAYDIRYPFLESEWVGFILNVPAHNRTHQALYRQIQKSSWPHLFNKWNSPVRDDSRIKSLIHKKADSIITRQIARIFPVLIFFLGANKNVNYIDWNHALMKQDDFKSVVYTNLQDLKFRKIIDWLDIEKLWSSHQKKEIFLASELMTLAALEIHLKVQTFH